MSLYLAIPAAQSILLAFAIIIWWTLRLPNTALVPLAMAGLLNICVVVAGNGRPRLVQISARTTTVLMLFAAGWTLFGQRLYPPWMLENAQLIGLLAISSWLTLRRLQDPASRRRWRAVFLAWTSLTLINWLGAAYLENFRGYFYLALLAVLVFLVALKRVLALKPWAVQVANTLMLLVIGIPAISFLLSPAEPLDVPPKLSDKPYSYETWRDDPAMFARWTLLNREEGSEMFQSIFDPTRPARLTPNSTTTFFENRIAINSLGFRDAEFPVEKGDTYRIVALGESTTFGITMEPDDDPWPARLERLIRKQLNPARPVQVINAGIPGVTLEENLERLITDILPLKPDMILSYHGYNGFRFIYDGMPPISGKPAPAYKRRPIQLLANVEFQQALRKYRQSLTRRTTPRQSTVDPLASQYANLYRQLIDIAQTNGIALALATYSMAVNEQSPSEVVEFYRLSFLGLEWQLKACAAHATIVETLARSHPELMFVDTRPHLDGRHSFYYDLVHFTPEGKERVAELFFQGIRSRLERELSQPRDARPSVRAPQVQH